MEFRYRVKLFGITAEIVGSEIKEIISDVELDNQSLISMLKESYPELKKIHSLGLAVNHAYAQSITKLNPEDEIALIPPVSGG